jgi:hypothetical protein
VLGTRKARQIRADLGDQHFSGAPADTGDGLEQGDGLVLSGQALGEFGVDARDGRVQVLQVGELLARAAKMWWTSRRPTTAWASASRLARSFPCANSANARASVSPLSKAARISRAERPRTSVTTAASLILASSSTACSRLVSRARSSTRWMR